MNRLLICLYFAFLISDVSSLGDLSSDVIIKNIDRTIDISTQLCKVSCKLQVENAGKSPVNVIYFAIDPLEISKVSYISARTSDSGKDPLKVVEAQLPERNNELVYKIALRESLMPGKFANIEVEFVITDVLSPYPTSITQKEKQLIRFNSNHYIYSPYVVNKQTTVINLGTKNVESFSKLNPFVHSDSTITYGPYHKIAPYSNAPLMVHYENNSPFLKVVRLERQIEVSHWGNIAVEETVDLLHTGAVLKGAFSRFDFQREAQSGLSSVKSFKTVLPAAASDAYYRDDIGNISTSHMKILSDSVELDLRPRFPLFGGWRTHYVLGYNVPSYEYLFNSGDNYKLKMRVMDHVFDDMLVDELITKVILPEGSESIKLTTPYPMTRLPNFRHSTYLDIKGRPVVMVTKRNLIENHIQDFELDYIFPRILMLQEPLIVTVALYLLFLLVIMYVRLDLSISKDEAGESKLRVSGVVDKLLNFLDNRANTYSQMDDQLNKLKASKDVHTFNSSMKNINQDYKTETNHILELSSKIKSDAPEIAEKLSELQKLDRELKEIYNKKQSLYVEKLVSGKIGRNAFVEAEAVINKKKDETIEKINNIIKNLH